MLEEIIIATPDEVIDTIIKYGVTMDFMKWKYFYIFIKNFIIFELYV